MPACLTFGPASRASSLAHGEARSTLPPVSLLARRVGLVHTHSEITATLKSARLTFGPASRESSLSVNAINKKKVDNFSLLARRVGKVHREHLTLELRRPTGLTVIPASRESSLEPLAAVKTTPPQVSLLSRRVGRVHLEALLDDAGYRRVSHCYPGESGEFTAVTSKAPTKRRRLTVIPASRESSPGTR